MLCQRYKYLRGLPVQALSYNAWYTQIQAAEADGLLSLEIFLHEDTISNFEDELGRCWESSDSEPHPDVWNKLRHEIVQEAINEMLVPAAVTWLRDDLKQRADDIVAERCQKELENVSQPWLSSGTKRPADSCFHGIHRESTSDLTIPLACIKAALRALFRLVSDEEANMQSWLFAWTIQVVLRRTPSSTTSLTKTKRKHSGLFSTTTTPMLLYLAASLRKHVDCGTTSTWHSRSTHISACRMIQPLTKPAYSHEIMINGPSRCKASKFR